MYMNIIDRVNKIVNAVKQTEWKKEIQVENAMKKVMNRWFKSTSESNSFVKTSSKTGYVFVKGLSKVVFIYITDSGDWNREMQHFNYYINKVIGTITAELKNNEKTLEQELFVINRTDKDSVNVFRNHFDANSCSIPFFEIIGMTENDIVRKKIGKHSDYVEYLEAIRNISDDEKYRYDIEEIEKMKCMLKLNVDNKTIEEFYSKTLKGNNISDIQKAVERIKYVCSLPYKLANNIDITIDEFREELNKQIYGMTEAKEAVTRYFAARKIGAGRNKILCLSGTPGTGKSLLAETVSKIFTGTVLKINCNNVRGADDYIRGHSYTFLGSAPGEIMMALEKANTKNACIVLEEIEKGTIENVRDIQSSLITILDPQNSRTFRDRYLQTDFDISDITFVVTCNDLSRINPVLLDRLEIVNVKDYTTEEKIVIAKDFIIPGILKEMNISSERCDIHDDIYTYIVKVAKIRSLRKIKESLTKLATDKLIEIKDNECIGNLKIDMIDVMSSVSCSTNSYLDEREMLGQNITGVATVLSIDSNGNGVVSHTTAVVIRDNMAKITIGGNVSEVIKESTETAVNYIKSFYYSKHKKVKEFVDKKYTIHVQEKGFGIRKEGVSGGVSTALAVYSAITEKSINRMRWATTGELDLTGQILPVGSIDEKTDAAYEAGIENVITPNGITMDEVIKRVFE